RMPWQKTLRASVSVVDADGVERHVRVIGRTLRARTALALLKSGDMVRIIGRLALAESKESLEQHYTIKIEVDSATLIPERKQKTSILPRRLASLNFWRSK
ncbi:hypothetical protein, partial [Caballeronia sp. M23-90]